MKCAIAGCPRKAGIRCLCRIHLQDHNAGYGPTHGLPPRGSIEAERKLARRRARRRKTSRWAVYFFRCGDQVKIAAFDPATRIFKWQTASYLGSNATLTGLTPTLLGSIPGLTALVRALQERFAEHRVYGEWFRFAPIADDIERLFQMVAVASFTRKTP